VSEAKVFCTKTRAPFLCVIEVYRPEEVQFRNVDDKEKEPAFDDLESGERMRHTVVGAPDLKKGGSLD